MVKISIQYSGDLHCEALHGPSKSVLQTDAPVDNQGRGESFSPTDLVATALGTCMATIMGILAKRRNVALEGMRIEVTKEMTQSGPRKIARLSTEIWMPEGMEKDVSYETAALSCPVHQSLHPDVDKPISFHWN